MATQVQLTILRKQAGEPALDHQAYFAEGLRGVQRMAHRVWTDHNLHDPGITTLEMLGYALTDLSYRAAFPIEDLLASETDNAAGMRAQFFTARQILPTRPVTLADYRKMLIDLKGVKNAWLRTATVTYFADTIDGELLRTNPGGVGIVPVTLRGLYDVLIDFMDGVTTNAERQEIQRRALRKLQANRNLCEDFVGFDQVPTQRYIICAELEVAPDADVSRIHAELLFLSQEYLAPPVLQYTLTEMMEKRRADGTRHDAGDIFDGPALDHGFIDDEELERAELRTEIHLSDLISIVMDIDGVRAIRDIVIQPANASEAPENRWRVDVPDGTKALLDLDKSRLVFYKRNMPSLAKAERVAQEWERLADAAVARVEMEEAFDLDIPLGTYRRPDRYYSFQNHFPAVYGLSDVGLVGAADDRRLVLSYQLKAYLLFFDQLMADYFAQLSRVRDLFSLDFADPELQRTYYHQMVDSFRDYNRIYRVEDAVAAIQADIDDEEVRVDRRNRFLDHLISRFAERFHDFAGIMRSEFGASAAGMVRFKCEFLRDYPATSSGRAVAYDYSRDEDADLWNSLNVSGLERRLARLLGIPNPARRNLGEIAYDVYAEIDETPGDEFRFRVRKRDTGRIILSGSRTYLTRELATAAMRVAMRYASVSSGYRRLVDVNGRHYFNLVDELGQVVGRRIGSFATVAEMNAAIDELTEYVREEYSEEGMYLVENILLRPSTTTDPFLPICPDPNCAECAEEDPYSYRIHVILPAYGGRFGDMEFRRWAEEVIREETPAHIQPKVCWISAGDMSELEKLYRDWIYLKAGKVTTGRAAKLTAFYDKLYRVKNVYPTQRLRECDAEESAEKFILGRTALGTLTPEPEPE